MVDVIKDSSFSQIINFKTSVCNCGGKIDTVGIYRGSRFYSDKTDVPFRQKRTSVEVVIRIDLEDILKNIEDVVVTDEVDRKNTKPLSEKEFRVLG